MGSIGDNDEQTAYLYNTQTKAQTVVHKGTEISVGDIQGTVVAVEPKYIQIKRGSDVFQLNIGKDLRSMIPTSALNGGADLMDAFGDGDGAPAFARDRFPPGGPGGLGDPAGPEGGRGDRPDRGEQGGGGFRSRRSRGPDSLPGDE
jgi:hypothetical protein